MKKQFLALCAAFLPFESAIASDNANYFGAGYHIATYDEDGAPEFNPTGVKLELGRYLTPNLAIEAHVGLGVSGDSGSYQNLDVEVELDNSVSLFLKGDIDLTDSANLYGLLGYTKGKLSATASGTLYGGISGMQTFNVRESSDDSGLSYGLGIENGFGPGVVLSAEYVMYLSQDDYDYSSVNLGIAKQF